MEIDYSVNWQNIHPNFTEELIKNWNDYGFVAEQVKDWINIGLNPQDYNFAHFLKNIKQFTAEEVLNNHQAETLRNEFIQWQEESQTQLQAQIQINPFK